jgi:hypothetical protein
MATRKVNEQPTQYVRVILVNTREIRDTIADEDVRDFLKFRTTLGAGSSKIHIVNSSAFTVETDRHVIERGDTLCAKHGETDLVDDLYYEVTCPGCLAIGKGIAVRDLTDEQLLSIV